MDNSYSTNLNGYNSGYNPLDAIEAEANGKINIHKINYNRNSNNPSGMRDRCKNRIINVNLIDVRGSKF